MSLQVLVNGFDITNGITHRINWVETSGLFDPAALVDPEAVDTFEGPFRVRQTTTDYGLREVSISGILIVAASDYASKLRALDGLQAIYAPRPSRVVVGTLELSVDFGRVQVASDQLKRLNGMIKYTVTGTAIPATFACTYGAGTGLVQGIPVDTQRVNEAAILATMASGVGTITNPGDVPTPAVLTIQNNPAASRVYYLATSATGRRVPVSTDANGVGRIDERAGLYLAPGVNRITAYQAATGTATFTDITVMSFFGTTWRYSGNAVAGNATRFDLGPALTVNRTGSARVFRGNTNPALNGTDGIVTAGDDEPRIGWVWQNRRNLIVNSLNMSTGWTSTLALRTQGGALEPFGYSDNSFSVMTLTDTGTGSIQHNQYALISLSSISYTGSVYILKDNNTTRRAGIFIGTGAGSIYAMINTSTGVAQLATNSTLGGGSVSSSDAGLWWRLSVTWTGQASFNDFRLAPAIGPTSGTDASITTQGTAVFACPQVEIGTTPTAYQATDASGISLDHPVNDSGLVLEGTATNLCLQSEAFSTTWTVPVGASITLDAAVSPAGTQTADRLTSSGLSPASEQTITVAASTTYTFSCWVKAVSGTVTAVLTWENASSPFTVYATTSATVGTNWTRLTATGSTPAGVTSIKVRVQEFTTNSIDVWGAQFEAGTAATSYIPTTTTSASRLAETAGLVSPHNLLTYSDQFDNAAWVKTGTGAVTANFGAGPDGITASDRVTFTASGATDIIRQTPAGNYASKILTFSVWLKAGTSTSVTIRITDSTGAVVGTASTVTMTSSWQRFFVTATANSTQSTINVDLRAGAIGNFEVYGAQLTEGYLPGRYVRTTDTNVLPVSMIDPSWSQNGYIEADFQWIPRSTGIGVFFGEGIVSSGPVAVGGLRFQTDNGGPWVVFARFDSTGTQRTVLQTSSTVYNRGYARVRGEWTNYLLAGNRYMLLRIYVDGVLISETNFAGTAGSSWPIVDVTRFFRANTALGVVSNLVIGTPSLPEGATAAGI